MVFVFNFAKNNLKDFTMSTKDDIKKSQLDWARENDVKAKGLYCEIVYDNIFNNKLLENVEARFKKANGNELIDSDKAKMRALHSSSAFCVNVFQYLLENEMLDIVSDVLGFKLNPLKEKGGFECKFPIKGTKTGNRFPANLDFVIEGANELIAIESKFTEPYGKVSGDSRLLKRSYLDPKSNYEFIINRFPMLKKWIDTWETEKYDENKKARVCPYEYLDAAQLIKHLLGLSSQNKNYKLCYLYYCVSSEQMKKHSEELKDFQERLNNCIIFKAMSYQEFFNELKLKLKNNEHKNYLDYMKDRYNL